MKSSPAESGATADWPLSSFSGLWEVAVDFAPVESADEGDGIAVDDQADPVTAGPDAVIGAFRFQLLQVGDGGDAAGGIDFENDVLYAVQQLFVLAEPLDVLNKALPELRLHAYPSRALKTSFRLTAPESSPSWMAWIMATSSMASTSKSCTISLFSSIASKMACLKSSFNLLSSITVCMRASPG
jgi:hypothetical protein